MCILRSLWYLTSRLKVVKFNAGRKQLILLVKFILTCNCKIILLWNLSIIKLFSVFITGILAICFYHFSPSSILPKRQNLQQTPIEWELSGLFQQTHLDPNGYQENYFAAGVSVASTDSCLNIKQPYNLLFPISLTLSF